MIASSALPLISIPGIDAETLAARGFSIGGWPAGASGGLNALTRMILASEADTAAALDRLGDRSLGDIEDASDAELEAVETVAWAFKRLMIDMRRAGGEAVHERLSPLTSAAAIAKLEAIDGVLRVDLLHPVIDGWFPGLSAEVEQHEAGEQVSAVVTGAASADADDLGPLLPGQPARVGDADDLGPLLDVGMAAAVQGVIATAAVQGVIAAGFAIRYRPPSHGDRIMRGLFDFAALVSTKRGDAGGALLDQLRQRAMDGQCAKCHTIDRERSGKVVVNWHSKNLFDNLHGFTTFSHAPHVALSGELACLSCHELDPESDRGPTVGGVDPHQLRSNFRPISKSLCADCHKDERERGRCTTCHNYHAAETRPVVRNAPVHNAIPAHVE